MDRKNEKIMPICRIFWGQGADEALKRHEAQYATECHVFDRHTPPAPKDLLAGESDITLARFRSFCTKLVREGADRPILIRALFEFVDEGKMGELLDLLDTLCHTKQDILIADPCRCTLSLNLASSLSAFGYISQIADVEKGERI